MANDLATSLRETLIDFLAPLREAAADPDGHGRVARPARLYDGGQQ